MFDISGKVNTSIHGLREDDTTKVKPKLRPNPSLNEAKAKPSKPKGRQSLRNHFDAVFRLSL